MMKLHLTIAALVALLGAGVLAPTANAAADVAYRVAVADLDLRSASGVEALYARLRTAALAVCGFDEARGYAQRQRARRCVGATLDAAVKELALDSFRPERSAIRAKRQLLQLARADRHGYGGTQPLSRSPDASL